MLAGFRGCGPPNLKQFLNCDLVFYIPPMLVMTGKKGILQWFHHLTHGTDANISQVRVVILLTRSLSFRLTVVKCFLRNTGDC